MSLLFFDGFDNALTVSKPEWDIGGTWTGSVSGRDGVTNGAVYLEGSGTRIVTFPSAAATCVVGAAFLLRSGILGSTTAGLYQFRIGTTVHAVLNVDASGYLQLRLTSAAGTVLASSSASGTPVSIDAWNHIQVKIVLNTTGGSCTVKLNNITVITYSGQTATAAGAVSSIAVRGTGSASVFYLAIDDWWVCDAVDATATQGRPNNDFLGDLRVATILPNAAGDSTQWTPSTGANWAAVDENPVNTTDYVSSATSGQRDLYNMGDLPASTTAVYGLRTGLYAQKSDAGTAIVRPVIKELGGTVTTQTQYSTSNTWLPYYGSPMYVKPSNNAIWSPGDINGIQAGIDIV